MKPSITRITLMLCCCLIFGAVGCTKTPETTAETARADAQKNDVNEEQGSTPLIRAALAGSADEVARLLKEGADVNGRGSFQVCFRQDALEEDVTPLMAAAYALQPEIVRQLIAAGADVNATSKYGSYDAYSALLMAFKQTECFYKLFRGNPASTEPLVLPIVQALLKAGAKVDAVHEINGWTPLMLAAEYGHSQTAEALIAAGADVNAKSKSGQTALMKAADRGFLGHDKMIGLLIQSGADVKLKDDEGWSALGLETSFFMATPLQPGKLAPGRDPGEMGRAISLLLAAGADPNDKTRFGGTVLMEASVQGCPEGVKALLKAGADVNARYEKDQSTALLHVAASNIAKDDVTAEVAKLLLDAGADIHATDRLGNDALLKATLQQKKSLAKLLIDRGADPKRKNLQGESAEEVMKKNASQTADSAPVNWEWAERPSKEADALLFAVWSGNVKEIRALAAKGVPLNVATVMGSTPWTLALAKHRQEVIRTLVELFGDVNKEAGDPALPPPLYSAVYLGNEEAAELLLSLKADVNRPNPAGWTPILAAAERAHYKLAKRLLEAGANVNAVTRQGLSALHITLRDIARGVLKEEIREKGIDFVKALIRAGADVNAKDAQGMTPLMFASIASLTEIVPLLLKAGADVNAKDGEGKTALDWATSEDVKTILMDAGKK